MARVAAVLGALSALGMACASAGRADQPAPSLAPGQFTFAFVDEPSGSPTWDPRPGQTVYYTVRGRLRRPARTFNGRGELRLRARYQPADSRCAASYARDQGIGLPAVDPEDVGRRYATRWNALIEPGIRLVTTSADVDGRRHPAIRVCGWVGYSPRQEVKPVTEVIPLLTRLFGAAAVGDGSYWTLTRPSYWVTAASTAPFTAGETDVYCGSTEPGPLHGAAGPTRGGLYGDEEGTSGGCPGDSASFSFTSSVLGPLSMTFPADASLAPGAPTVHIGNACVLGDDGAFQTVAQAAAFVRAQGCNVGHVLVGPIVDQFHGSVSGFYRDGDRVDLAPLGTTVDLVTEGVPPAVKEPSPGGGELKEPEGGECEGLAALHPKFAGREAELVKLPGLSSRSLGVSLSAGITLGAVKLCDRAISSVVPRLDVRTPGLGLTAAYRLGSRKVDTAFTYAFAPLGWHKPPDSGGPPPAPSSIDWSRAVKFGGEAGPTLSFAYTPGQPLEPSIDLIRVPVAQSPVTLLSRGQPVLEAGIGPELSFGLSFDRKALAESEKEDVGEGEEPDAAAQEISEELGDDVSEALSSEGSTLAPASDTAALAGQSTDITTAVQGALDSELPTDATVLATEEGADTSLLAADGLLDVAVDGGLEALIGDETIEVLAIAIVADAHHPHPPPADLQRSTGRVLAHRGIRARPVSRAALRRLVRRHRLHRAPFPRRRIASLVRGRVHLTVPARVGRLATSARRLRGRETLTVVAPFLGRARQAQLTLSGPSYRATRMLRIAHGTAGATIRLPRRLAPGTWTIAVTDRAGVRLAAGGHGLTGAARVRMGVFTVPRPRRHRRR